MVSSGHSKPATEVKLTPEDAETLQKWCRTSTTEQRLALRARVVLAAARNESTVSIASREKVRRATVSKWRQRYAQQGLRGLPDVPRPGPRLRYGEATPPRVLKQLDQLPPSGYARWNGRLLAEALGDVSPRQVWRILSRLKISGSAAPLVHQHRPGVCPQGGRHRGHLPPPAGERGGPCGGRKAPHSSLGTGAGVFAAAQRQDLERVQS